MNRLFNRCAGLLALALAGVPLAGCVPDSAPGVSIGQPVPQVLPPHVVDRAGDTPSPQADLSGCGGNDLWALVGQPVAHLPEAGAWRALRVIKPGMMVTMDYSATRLNVNVDGAGTILSLSCG